MRETASIARIPESPRKVLGLGLGGGGGVCYSPLSFNSSYSFPGATISSPRFRVARALPGTSLKPSNCIAEKILHRRVCKVSTPFPVLPGILVGSDQWGCHSGLLAIELESLIIHEAHYKAGGQRPSLPCFE